MLHMLILNNIISVLHLIVMLCPISVNFKVLSFLKGSEIDF